MSKKKTKKPLIVKQKAKAKKKATTKDNKNLSHGFAFSMTKSSANKLRSAAKLDRKSISMFIRDCLFPKLEK